MKKQKVLVTRIIPTKGLDMVKAYCDAIIWEEDFPIPREALIDQVRGMEGILSMLTDRMDGVVMDAAGTSLKVISTNAVGVDNIDLAAATQRKIPVGNTPGILTDSTADFAFALLMASARRIVEGDAYIRKGLWKTWGPSILLGQDVAGATIGIIGFGRIGQAVAKRAAGFGMRILYYEPGAGSEEFARSMGAQSVDLDTLLKESDFVSLHTPLNAATVHFFNENLFSKMKKTAILINTSRGPVVDANALYQALKEHKIGGAALDVTDPEPLPMDSPLLTLDNILIMPHIASASHVTREKMAVMAAENLIAGLKGERLPHCANEEVYPSS